MKILLALPHYNHNATLRQVVQAALAVCADVAVFDDGSSVSPVTLLSDLPVHVVRFERNRGKGQMILEAAQWAQARGFTHLATLDTDGQHHAADFPRLAHQAQLYPQSIIIGKRKFDKKTVPFSSRFGRAFGGFWIHFQTGQKISDIQSGYRIYPLAVLTSFPLRCARYALEVEVVARAKWAGFGVEEVDVSVTYPKDRISHFHKWKDNLRLTLLNTLLTLRSMLPWPHRQYALTNQSGKVARRGYWEVMLENLAKPHSAALNARSAAWGIFCGSIALPGVRQVMLFAGAGFWNLNRVLAISFEKLCIGPIVPALCIEAGFFLRYGRFLTEFNLTTLGRQFLQRVWEWVIGSLVVAPLLAVLVFGLVWAVGKYIQWRLCATKSRNHGA